MFKQMLLAYAKKIQAKEDAKLAKIQEEDSKRREDYYKVKADARIILRDEIDRVAKTLNPDPNYAKEGDRAILNIYQLKFKGEMNGWDGGPNCLIGSQRDPIESPIFVKIDKISVDKSYATEMVDRFLDDVHRINLLKMDKGTLISNFKNYASRSIGHGDPKNLGLYFSATFDTYNSFKPVWSLSLSSFLPESAPEAKLTEEIWKEEIEIKTALKKINERKTSLELRLREIGESYRGIKIIS